MRRLLVALAIAAAFVIPATASAIDPPNTAEQSAALGAPNAVYLPAAGNACGIEFTPNLARTWWTRYFADPLDLAAVRPGLLPGSLVLTPAEYEAAVTLNARGNTLPDAPRDWNPLALAVTPGLVGANGIAFCPTDSIAPIPLGATVVTSAVGPTAAQLKAIRSRALAVGKHPTSAQVLATWYRHH